MSTKSLLILEIVSTVLLGCGHRESDGSNDTDSFYSVEEQRNIKREAGVLWNGADPYEDWESIVTRLMLACGGTAHAWEIFQIASYHPRAELSAMWRSELEHALFKRAKVIKGSTHGPLCRLVRRAMSDQRPTHSHEMTDNNL